MLRFRLAASLLLACAVFGVVAVGGAGATVGPVGWWTLDEPSGAVAFDSSGNANDGAVVGATQGQPGQLGTAYGFAGTTATRVDIPMTAILRPAQLTLSAWVNPSSFACGQCAAVSSETANGTVGYGLRVFSDGTLQWCGYGGVFFGACTYSAGGSVGLNTWSLIVGQYDGAFLKSFVNGVQVSSAFVGGFSYDANLSLRIGGSPFGMVWYGLIDDVRVYDRALSPAEVAALAVPPLSPASCTAILLGGGSTGNGVYTIDPAQNGQNVSVYCDMTTDGGGWTLAGYGANANLGGKLTVANGTYNPTSRSLSANIASVALARGSTEVSLSWSTVAANGSIGSYQKAVSYEIPSPASQTLDPLSGGFNCVSSMWSPVTVKPLVGAPALPSLMYTRTASLGAVYGLAYGLARSDGNPQCDWTIDGQAFRAVYLGIAAPSYATGVVYEPGGVANHQIPATMAIWFRGAVTAADATPPTAAPTQSPAANGAGWNSTDVVVTWNWSDEAGGSGIDAGQCTTSSTSSGEGTLTLSATCKDLAGNTGSASTTVKVDKTAPVISGSASPAANGAGWNNTDVTVSFTCADEAGGSGIATDTVAGDTVTTDGAGQSVTSTGVCVDMAGNAAAPATVGGIDVDKTAPVLAPSVSPDPVALNGAATASANASDALSGLASSSCGAVDTSAVGPGSVTCTATDNAGNSASASVSFLVTVMASKQAVLAEIEAELAIASKRDRSELREAARQLRKSLDPSNWVDGNHLRVKKGEHVFENEKEAVQKLRELLKDRKSGVADATLQGWIDTLVAVDRALAQIAIDEATAAGGNPKRLAEAAREMAKAADALARGKPAQAIEHYKHAWKKIQKTDHDHDDD